MKFLIEEGKTKNIFIILGLSLILSIFFTLFWFGVGQTKEGLDNNYKDDRYVPNEIVIKYKLKPTTRIQKQVHKKLKAKKAESNQQKDIEKITIANGESINKILAEAKKDPNIELAEPNYIYKIDAIPNDSLYGDQWGLTKIDGPSAWDINTGTASSIIAIIDTGVDYNHLDLTTNIWINPGEDLDFDEVVMDLDDQNLIDDDGNGQVDDLIGWDFVNDDANPMDDEGHGTNVAGIASAATNNSTGLAGVSWNSQIMAIKSFDIAGIGTTFEISQGIQYAYKNGAQVINLSFGSTDYSSLIQSEINTAHNSYGCVIIGAAGNEDPAAGIFPPTTVYPAAMDNVISVGSTNSSDVRPSWSNYGNFMDVCAPGSNIRVPKLGGGYGYSSGTSMSAPHASGLASLLLSHSGGLSTLEIENFIIGGTNNKGSAGWDKYYGSGRLNMYRSLKMAEGYQRLFAPNITKYYSGWTTPLVVQNVSGGSGMVFNTFVDDNSEVINGYGSNYGNGQSVSFNPQHTNQVASGFQGSAFVASNVNAAGIINEHSESSSMAYEIVNAGAEEVYLPNITKEYFGWTTPFVIQSLEMTKTASIKVYFYNPGSSTARYIKGPINIKPASSYGLNPSRISNSQIPTGWKGSVVVKSTNGTKVMAIVNEHADNQSMSYNGFTSGSTEVYLPNITRYYSGWTTPFIIQNISTSNASLKATFYRRGKSSKVLELNKSSLAPNSSWSINPRDYPSLDTFQGSVVVSSNKNVVAIVNEHSSIESMAYSGISLGKTKLYLPNITKKYFGWTTPFIIQNMSGGTATVTIKYYKSSGSLQKTTSNKKISSGGSLFINPSGDSGIPSSFKGSVVITSNQPVGSIVNEHKTDGQAMSYNGF